MSMFLPEGSKGNPPSGTTTFTPGSPETTQEDIALMQRAFQAAAQNPNLMPDQFMAYLLDYIQTSRLQIPIGQVFGYQRIAPQVITDFAQVPSPVDGQIVLLRVGSSPYTYVQMMFDQSTSQWVSEEFSAGGGNGTAIPAEGTKPVGGKAGISWASVHSGGLTMQLKWSGTLNSDSGVPHGGIHLFFGNLSSGSTTATMSDQSGSSGATVAVGVDWTTVSDPGAYAVVGIGIYLLESTGGGTTTGTGVVVGRFIRPV